MDDLYEFEIAGLVSKVVDELQNHLGVIDKTLAEFIIAQRLEADTSDSFKRKMKVIAGDNLSMSLVDSIDRLLCLLHPTMKANSTTRYEEAGYQLSDNQKSHDLTGLTVPDTVSMQSSIESDLAMLEALEPKERQIKQMKRRRDCSLGQTPGSEKSLEQPWRNGEPETDLQRKSRYGRDDYGMPNSEKQRRHGYRCDDRHKEDQEMSRRSRLEVDDAPVLQKTYHGHVTALKDFGAFVNIHGIKQKAEGLVHISQLSNKRVNHPSDLLERGQCVKVRVISTEGTKIGLSMKDNDQETGPDVAFHKVIGSGAGKLQRKRLTSPERWEIRQLIASGVAKSSDYPQLEEDYNATLSGHGEMELEEDVDIEVKEEEPPFLAGQTSQSLKISPIRIIKALDGSLNRAALFSAMLAKERREIRELEAAEAVAETVEKVDLSSQWNDPMADTDKHKFASDLGKSNAVKCRGIPEWKVAATTKGQTLGKRTHMTIKEQRESLPVFTFRSQLIEAIKQHPILVVVGETGSGKTTQMIQYLAEAGFANSGIIGCTQPRRVAVLSVAKRVSQEVGCVLGEEVGYSIRFDCTSQATRVKYMTDGMLQREILIDPDLKRYSVIMLDEAHERTIATDILFALLKKALKRRSDFKLIVTSATLNADKFSTYFDDAPIFTIPGRTFPVEILYSQEPEPDYLESALATVMQIHLMEPIGDILLFLTGQEEIDTACEVLHTRIKALGPSVPDLLILPVYAGLPPDMQNRIFELTPPGSRKVVVATNIAETSITIDNIYYIIDPGFVKQNAYDPKLSMDSLVITPISQAQANQRAGRAGRTGPGKCFRLYTESAYQSEMLPSSIPDIQRHNLCTTILMLKAMGINDLLHFDFMDPPPVNTMLTALEELYALSALDDEGLLTRLGRQMADFPMAPSLAKVLILAGKLGCSDEVLTIVAMLNLTNVFYRPKEKQEQADQKKAKFHDQHGDHLTLLNVYNSWKKSGYSSSWCFENYIQSRSMNQAKDIRTQLVQIMERYHHSVVSCGPKIEHVRRAFCAGFFRNAARRDTEAGCGGYKTLIECTPIFVHPSSALFGKQSEWVIYHELVLTTREYMR
jgi:ATP-dependent RNA helicase DHX8/PRP22